MLNFDYLMEVSVDVGEIVTMGHAPLGERRVVSILGGTFEGAELKGEVLAGGADWQIVRKDGVLDVDARYVLKEDDGSLIQVISQGYRHGSNEVISALARGEEVAPSKYFFRTVMRFETGAPHLEWLNKTIAITSAKREFSRVILSAYRLL